MMEAVRTSETSVNINLTTWRYIPEDSKLQLGNGWLTVIFLADSNKKLTQFIFPMD
jgi:hypothetical protein